MIVSSAVFKPVRSLAHAVAPELYKALLQWWQKSSVAHTPSYPAARLESVAQKFLARYGLTVLDGPFCGMKYVGIRRHNQWMNNLLGCYEEELHSILNGLTRGKYDAIVNIGCAEGYYAVGLALRIPGVPIHAFDLDPEARQLCREMAEVNEVSDRLKVDGACRPEHLRALVDLRTLVVCDCEGGEMDLFDVETVRTLARSDVLIELHDCINPVISSTIINRFSRSHKTTLVTTVARDPDAYPLLDFLEPEERALAVNEFRLGPMQWALFTART